MEEEIWKDIPSYEGYYQASTLGRIKSIDRDIFTRNGVWSRHKGRILKQVNRENGYMSVRLHKRCVGKTFQVQVLICMTFLGYVPGGVFVADHINENPKDNRLSNLQVISQRANVRKSIDKTKTGSSYFGVYYWKDRKKWVARIFHNRTISLGNFNTEEEAHAAVVKAENDIANGREVEVKKYTHSSAYTGVCFVKSRGVWRAYYSINKVRKNIGSFKTEKEAHDAREKYILSLK